MDLRGPLAAEPRLRKLTDDEERAVRRIEPPIDAGTGAGGGAPNCAPKVQKGANAYWGSPAANGDIRTDGGAWDASGWLRPDPELTKLLTF